MLVATIGLTFGAHVPAQTDKLARGQPHPCPRLQYRTPPFFHAVSGGRFPDLSTV
jgi:hypothetical protein